MFRYAFSMEHFRHRLAHNEALPQMVLLGILCGALCGLVLGLFRFILEAPLGALLPGNNSDNFEGLPTWMHFTLPIIGSLFLIAILGRVSPLNRKAGVTHLLERMAYHQSQLPLINFFIQFAAASIALLFGHSVGKEGPSIHLGAACGSQLGQKLNLPNNTLRILAGCGTAAGIAAMFNTPLAGVVFAMEVVLLEYTVIGFMPVMVAAATGTLVMQLIFGGELALAVPSMNIQTLHEIPYVAFLGGIIGLLAVVFIKTLTKVMRWSENCSISFNFRLLLAGLLTGIVAIYVPQVMGIGYDTVTLALQGNLGIGLLAGILLAKILLTPIVLGLGVPAGLIGPSLFIGAIAGALLGIIGGLAVDQETANPGFYALLGMGSMMGAVVNAPMAALVAILELTGNPSIIFPAMISIVIANLIARYVFKTPSIFVSCMQIQGMDYRFQPLNQLLNRSAVGSLMKTNFVKTDNEISLQDANEILQTSPSWILLHTEERHSLLSPGDLHAVLQDTRHNNEPILLTEFPAMRLDAATLGNNATLQEALDHMTEEGVDALCITNRQHKIIGLLTRDQIEDHYRQS